MQKKRIILMLSIATILVIGMSTAAFAAADYQAPAEIVAGLTGKTIDEVRADRQAGTSYGAQAVEVDKLDEFQTERLALCEQNLDQAVIDGNLTQEEADKLLAEMTDRMEDCDGTGTGLGQASGNGTGEGLGICNGTGDGSGNGSGRGTGKGIGTGAGNGMGMMRGDGTGSGLGCGSCTDADDIE